MNAATGTALRVRVARKEAVARDVALFELVAADAAPLPLFTAGAHVDVLLPQGLTRQYSLCNDPREAHRYQIAVLKAANGRGGSRAMHENVNTGDVLSISAPRNQFALQEVAQESILFAGGIGITPLLSMAHRLATTGQRFTLHYCTRSREHTAFLDQIRQSACGSHVVFHFDDEVPGQRLDIAALLPLPRPGLHLYTCGPAGFMDAVLSAARASDWAEEQLHHESFGAVTRARANDAAFEVVLASSRRIVQVPPGQPVTVALAAAGVDVPTSCEQGVCGTCMTRVLDGQPDHRDAYLTDAEKSANDCFLPCCSRSCSARLVLDL